MKQLMTFLLLVFALVACSSSKQVAGQDVPIKQLHNYVPVPGYQPAASEDYQFITTEEAFSRLFTFTKMAPGSKTYVPDFTKEAVVAIILAPTDKVVTVEITRASLAGKNLNVSYTATDTATWVTFSHIPFFLAVVGKDSKIRKVNFINQGVMIKSLKVE